jgi:hypothetical protein
MIKSRSMRWVWHVACMGRKLNVDFLCESKKERDNWEDIGVDGRILKLTLQK